MNDQNTRGAPKESGMTTRKTEIVNEELDPCGKAHDAEQSRTEEIEEACNDSVS